jgi:protein-S-isoprenylcysteine O-methyltransferase Ste14
MPTQYPFMIPALLWLLWLLYWGVTASRVKTAIRSESLLAQASHNLPILLVFVLLALPAFPGDFLGGRMLPRTAATYWSGVAMLALGLGFAVWARVHLGRNWSNTVTLKRDHDLVRGGPYRLARHPIYTGALVAVLGTAIARGEWRGLLASAIVFAALWRKLGIEEKLLEEVFGDKYRSYRREVRALIPFVL